MGNQALVSGFAGGHRGVEVVFDSGQLFNEAVGSGSGAHANDALAVELRCDVGDSGLSRLLFEFVLGKADKAPLFWDSGKRINK